MLRSVAMAKTATKIAMASVGIRRRHPILSAYRARRLYRSNTFVLPTEMADNIVALHDNLPERSKPNRRERSHPPAADHGRHLQAGRAPRSSELKDRLLVRGIDERARNCGAGNRRQTDGRKNDACALVVRKITEETGRDPRRGHPGAQTQPQAVCQRIAPLNPGDVRLRQLNLS